METKEKILNYMTKENKPLGAGEVSKSLSLEKSEVDKVFTQLKKEEKIYSPVRCKWQIKRD